MTAYLRHLRNFFVSLQLTVVLLILSLFLVFIATLAQRHLDVWAVQEQYFRSFLVFWQPGGSDLSFPIYPGGYLIGGTLLTNLVCAHLYRFKLSWRKVGIQLAHSGLIILLFGELLAGLLQRDSTMRLEEGETKKYSESFRDYELAFLDKTNPDYDDVVAIPEAVLAGTTSIQHPKLPFRVRVKEYHPNVALQMRDPSAPASPVTAGVGARILMLPQPLTYKPDELNAPGAIVEIAGPEGPVGTWLVSPLLGAPQTFPYQGHTWEITLRLKRYYRPFGLTLLKVTHDIYPGTEIPKNFSSRVRLRSDDGREDREVLIFMNNPLRYGGATFFQYQMNAASHMTVFEVVRNPGWLLPYIACIMMALGLSFQFLLTLGGFFKKRSAAAPTAPVQKRPSRLPLLWLALGLAYLASTLRPPANPTAFDLAALGRMPVLSNGRIKPLDTVARNSLLTLKSSQRLANPDGRDLTPDEWLADVLFAPAKADTYRHFRFEPGSQEVLDLLSLTPEQGDDKKYFSYNQLRPKLDDLDRQARLADGVEDPLRSPFQKQLLNTRDHIVLYLQLKASVQVPESPDFATELAQFDKFLPLGIGAIVAKQKGQPHDEELVKAMKEMVERFNYMEQLGNLRLIPPEAGDNDAAHWRSAGTALVESFATGKVNAAVLDYARLGHAWRAGDSGEFNRIIAGMEAGHAARYPREMRKSALEARFNAAEPFYSSMVLYVLALLLAAVSWLRWPEQLGRAAFILVALAFAATTAGIATRMWLEGRPPVTNLYSSALFVGWGAVLLCLGLERIYRNGIGSVAGSLIGFATLLIAHHLSLGGDTLEMMRAVLDSNFWLATHVVVVTTGYASTFLAGFLALIYIFRGVFTRSLDQNTADSLTRMVYGIVCFATLFSFVGTVLGGIWADQSWGRFWGWDPKENGALIIVIWNATILHARWGGLVRSRGLMVMAVFGNIVTSWSWFGVNMLGIGLHSYGFMESTFYGLIAFVASQLLIMALALLPPEKWKSFRARPA